MGRKISGMDVTTTIGSHALQFEEVSLSIEDNSQSTSSRGRPNGYVRGAAKASGEITLDTDNFKILLAAAKSAGSWREIEQFDIVMHADVGGSNLKVEAFECLVKISDLLNADSKGEEKLTHKLPYEVTGKDFVKIDGVPYLEESEKEYLR